MALLLSPKRFKIIVSDFHLGKGISLGDGSRNLLEDFTSDRQFVEFLEHYLSGVYKRSEVELIINGDFFNFLQIDYRDQFTDIITEADSLHKLMSILRGHPEIFAKLGEFSRTPHHSVIFILGNHDPGLLWEGVQKVIRTELGGSVFFEMEAYDREGVWVEHGNQYLADNRYDAERYFLTEDLPEPIINLPFGSFLVIHYLNQVKKVRPYIDKVYPFHLLLRWSLIHDTWFTLKSLFRLTLWFFSFIFKPNPARKIGWRQVLGILKETTIHPKLHREAKRLLFSREDLAIVVFGHTHQHAYRYYGPGKEYFNSGTWNERISLDVGSLGRFLRLTFVQIEFDKRGVPHGALKEWKGKTNVVEDLVF